MKISNLNFFWKNNVLEEKEPRFVIIAQAVRSPGQLMWSSSKMPISSLGISGHKS